MVEPNQETIASDNVAHFTTGCNKIISHATCSYNPGISLLKFSEIPHCLGMTSAEIEAEIAIQTEIAAACNTQILALIIKKRSYNTSTGQTQIQIVNQSIKDLRAERDAAIAERERLEVLLNGGGSTQIRPYA